MSSDLEGVTFPKDIPSGGTIGKLSITLGSVRVSSDLALCALRNAAEMYQSELDSYYENILMEKRRS